jgi:hypothetical protein
MNGIKGMKHMVCVMHLLNAEDTPAKVYAERYAAGLVVFSESLEES